MTDARLLSPHRPALKLLIECPDVDPVQGETRGGWDRGY